MHTISGYGYRLGGPGNWRLPGMKPADQVRTPWYDETDPTNEFTDRAAMHIKARLGLATPELGDLPWTFETAAEVSPDGWTPETGAPPPLSLQLPVDSTSRLRDRAATEQYLLVIADSQVDRDEQELAYYHDGEDEVGEFEPSPGGAAGAGWDRTLLDALTMLGFEPDTLPGWLWYRQVIRW